VDWVFRCSPSSAMLGTLLFGAVVVFGNPQFHAGLRAMQEHSDATVAHAGRMTERLVHHSRRLQESEGNCNCPGAQAMVEASTNAQAEIDAQMKEDPLAAIVASQKLLCDHRAAYECMQPCIPAEEDAPEMNLDCTCGPCGDSMLSVTASAIGGLMLMAAGAEAQQTFSTQIMVEVCSPDFLLFSECMACPECAQPEAADGSGSATAGSGMPVEEQDCLCGSCRRAHLGVAVATTDAGKDHEACLNATILHCYASSTSDCSAMGNMTADMQASADALCSAADAEAALKAVVDPMIAAFGANYAYPPANRGKMCELTAAAKTATTTTAIPSDGGTASGAMALGVVPILAAILMWYNARS